MGYARKGIGRHGRLYLSRRPRSVGRHGSLSRRRGALKEIYYRRRIRHLRKKLAKERSKTRRSGGRPKICWESNDGFSQLYPRVQRGFRDWGVEITVDTGGSHTTSEMAKWYSWSEGAQGSSEEESFKGTREDVVSWIKSYPSNGRRLADPSLLPEEERLMKKRKKKKMGTAKGFPPYRPLNEQDTYIPNFVRTTEPPKEESNVERRKILDVLVSICIRAYRILKSFVLRK